MKETPTSPEAMADSLQLIVDEVRRGNLGVTLIRETGPTGGRIIATFEAATNKGE